LNPSLIFYPKVDAKARRLAAVNTIPEVPQYAAIVFT